MTTLEVRYTHSFLLLFLNIFPLPLYIYIIWKKMKKGKRKEREKKKCSWIFEPSFLWYVSASVMNFDFFCH
jgi:hypothetical protein